MKKRLIRNLINNKKLLGVLVVIFIALTAYKDINQIFFQQDEWLGLGGAIVRRETGGLTKAISDIMSFGGGVFRFLPFTSITNYIIFNAFGLNAHYYGVLALLFIIVNSLLIYLIANKLTSSSITSLFIVLLWMTNSSASQGAIWISALVPTQFSLLFFLLSFYLFIDYFQKDNKRTLFFSLFFMLISLWFKELGIYYLLVFPLYIWLFIPRLSKQKKVILTAFVLTPALIAILIPRLFVSNVSGISPSVSSSPISTENIVYNSFLLPARALYQVYVPYSAIYTQILTAKEVHYPEADAGVIESLVADSYMLLASFCLLFTILLVVYFAKYNHKKLVVFALVVFFSTMLPFVLFENRVAFIEQRFFVHPAIWASLLAVACVFAVSAQKRSLANILIIVVFTPLVIINTINIREKLAEEIFVGSYRKNILKTVSQVESELGENNIFYFYTDHTGFWEFQSGFGQTLAVWLYKTGKIPREALTDREFWDSSYEDIKEFNGRKYGYFMSYDKLLQALDTDESISSTDVHSFYWDYQKHTVTDVSGDIRNKLERDLEK